MRIQNKTVSALVDSGADISVMSSKFYRKLKLDDNTLTEIKSFATSANGSHLKIHGCACIPVEIGHLQLYQKFHISPNVSQDIILGLDFLKDQNHLMQKQKCQ